MTATLIIPDLHLGKGLNLGKPAIGNQLNSRIVDQLELLDWVFDQAGENNVSTIIFTGDVFEDPRPDFLFVELLINWLRKCTNSGLQVHIIVGNHDLIRSGKSFTSALDLITASGIEDVHVHKKITTIFVEETGFTLVPFRDVRSFSLFSHAEALKLLTSMLEYEHVSIPDYYNKVCVGHLAIEGSLMIGDEIDDDLNEIMCPVEMFRPWNYTWMGHIHKPQVRSRDPYVAHVGSLDLSDFGETDHKKIIVLFDPELPGNFKELPVPTRPLRRLRLSVPVGADSTDCIIAALEKISLKDAIVKLEIQLTGPESPSSDREKVEKFIYEKEAFHISNFSESRSISVVPMEKRDIDSTMEPEEAVKMYADIIELEEIEKSNFINNCKEIINQFKV